MKFHNSMDRMGGQYSVNVLRRHAGTIPCRQNLSQILMEYEVHKNKIEMRAFLRHFMCLFFWMLY